MNKITRKEYNKCLLKIKEVRLDLESANERVNEAMSKGDKSENSELVAESAKQLTLSNELANLIEITTNWDIISLSDVSDFSKIQIGATAKVKVNNEKLISYHIVGDYGSDTLSKSNKKKIGYNSPLAQLMIGKSVGHHFEYNSKKYLIESINYNDIT